MLYNVKNFALIHCQSVHFKLQIYRTYRCTDKFIGTNCTSLLIGYPFSGQRRGLSLILNAQQKLYVAAPRESVGFKILAHSRNERPPNMDDRGKELEPGTHVAFGLEVTEVRIRMTHLGFSF